MSQLGPIKIEFKQWESVSQNAFFCPDPARVAELEAYMDQLRRDQGFGRRRNYRDCRRRTGRAWRTGV
ncbi:hypothetical protein HSBAA_43000 [Vreelandella sulfidaeris]|uniref:Uncharacterized protein n=1 Tax=Vreelandella sulfidaeris TaxID=115553 RepID=A0A455UJ65_9GAMM|nr:hypothetical protein HSBAA_43000 [Halomonas sulfidaeris]